MKPYTFFNSVCILGCVFFVGATFFVWNRAHAEGVKYDPNVEALSFREFGQEMELRVKSQELRNEESTTDTVENTTTSSEDVVAEEIVEVVEEEPLPVSFNLAVPFTSQAPEKNWDQPWQDACEEAAILMLDAYYKEYNLSPLFAKDELLKMVAWEEERNWGGSIEIAKVKQVAEYFMSNTLEIGNWKLEILENPTVDQIKRFVAKGHPVYAVAYGKELPNPHFVNGGPEYHALIIRGYTDETFITNDPGTQFGENFEYQYDDLMNAIADWNEGDPKNGRSVVLVLE